MIKPFHCNNEIYSNPFNTNLHTYTNFNPGFLNIILRSNMSFMSVLCFNPFMDPSLRLCLSYIPLFLSLPFCSFIICSLSFCHHFLLCFESKRLKITIYSPPLYQLAIKGSKQAQTTATYRDLNMTTRHLSYTTHMVV